MDKNYKILETKTYYNVIVGLVDRQMKNSPAHYAVAVGLDVDHMQWNHGHYFSDYESAKAYYDFEYSTPEEILPYNDLTYALARIMDTLQNRGMEEKEIYDLLSLHGELTDNQLAKIGFTWLLDELDIKYGSETMRKAV